MQKLILVVGLTMANLQAVDTSPRPANESARQKPMAARLEPISVGPRRRTQPVFQWDGRLPFPFPRVGPVRR